METLEVGVNLSKDFISKFKEVGEKYPDEFKDLNGLSKNILNYTEFIDNFVDCDTVADASVDGNANVDHKDVVTLTNEMPKPHRKLLSYNKIYYDMKKLFGKESADDWFELEWNKFLYMHDADTASTRPYCYSYDLRRLAEEGLFFLDNFNNEPAKHLGTFIDFVKEFVGYCSNRTSGACGLANLIPYMYYFWREDVKNDYYTGTPKEYAKQHIQRFLYAVNQPCVRDGIQSAFTNTSVFDREYLIALFGGATFPDGSFMVDDIEEIMEFQKWYMETMSEIRSRNMFTFPVNTISLLKVDGEFKDPEFARWAMLHNMKWMDSNIFCSDEVNSLSNCCRLKSNIQDIGYFNSVGGSGLSVGSVKVSTINLARLSYMSETEEEYLKKLKEIVIIDLKSLHTVRHIIKRNVEKGLLPNYRDGLIDMKNQYNTVGVIGIYETMKTFGYTYQDEFGNTFYKDDAFEFGNRIFDAINEAKKRFIDEYEVDYMVNIEQVPAEQCAVKFIKADRMLFPDKVVDDLPLYGNQFIPLGIKTTLQERTKIASAFDDYCNGGSIMHVNVEAPFNNFDQMWDMLNYITDQGVTYFAFTTKINVCEDNHAFFGSKCATCGKPVAGQFSRIVGFYTPIRSYSKERKEEWKQREWHDVEAEDIGILR